MDKTEIKEIISRHQHWIKADCKGWKEMKANLRGANLYGVNLFRVDLRGADLYRANLQKAILREADLREADLRGVSLCETDLYKADLRRANLCGADLREANLYQADLRKTDLRKTDLRKADLREVGLYQADLRGANLYRVNLREANLYQADLRIADLYQANLYGADLREANLYRANNVPFIPYACPDFGAFTGFKKAHDLIIVLEIPEDARRLSATGRKCRCDKAKVIDIQNMDGTKANVTSVSSDRDNNFVYKIGEEVCVLDFDENRWNECSTGIHFFINRQEAVNYL